MNRVRVGMMTAVAVAAVAVPVGYAVADHGAPTGWQAAWRAAPQPPLASGPSHDGFTNQTVRMIVRPTVSGAVVRVRVSNRYGTDPLQIAKVAVAEHDTGPIVVATTQRVATFGGNASTTVAAGAEAVSDPVPFGARAGRDLVVSIHLAGRTGPATWHRLAQATSYISGGGNWATEPGGSPFQSITPSWFFLDGVDVLARPAKGTVVAFGDSITDGAYSTLDAHRTYPDWLARRAHDYAVLNAGIGGNQLLADTPVGGGSALQRFSHDVPDGSTAIVLEGTNDIGADATTQQIIDGLTQLVDAAHERCVRVIGATITPFGGSVYDTPAHEEVRAAVNAWIRTSGRFDGVVDFDRAIRDPADPLTIDPRYRTVGDLHPDDAGYQAMADAVDLTQLRNGDNCSNG